MTNQQHSTEIVSIRQICQSVNNDNLNEEIMTLDNAPIKSKEDAFPLRIDALVIALVTSGSGRIGIDLREYNLQKGSLIVVQPKNYIYLSSYSDDFRCMMLACSNRVVEDVLPKLTDILPMLMHHRTEPVILLEEKEALGIASFYALIRDKLRGEKTQFQKNKVLCILQAALYELMEIHTKDSDTHKTARSRKEEIMARFLLAVSESFRTERLVAYYAHKLCITPKHLSAVVKEISGLTAGDWIENYVIMEAKVLLKTTNMTIQEIAVYLNFANQSFFGKYFKHHTGVSPTTYRKENS